MVCGKAGRRTKSVLDQPTMASAVAELETGLQGMLALKPPGVSGSRITSLTALCVSNVQVSSRLRLLFAASRVAKLPVERRKRRT